MQIDPMHVRWRIHVHRPPEEVFPFLATAEGRSLWWAESAELADHAVEFVFPDGMRLRGDLLAVDPPALYSVRYVDGSRVTFRLRDDGRGGTDVDLDDELLDPDDGQILAGWVSILLALKVQVEFGADLRNHDRRRVWEERYCDN